MKKLLVFAVSGVVSFACFGAPTATRTYVDNTVKAAKCGEARSKSIVLYTTGDSSIKAAMDAGGITKIHHIDYKVFNIFNLYSTATTIVWGE